RNGCGIDVCEAERRVAGHDMSAAFRAELPVALFRLLEVADELRALRDLHVLGLPQGEGIHRARRPGSAGCAVAVAHPQGRALHFDLDRAAEAGAGMRVGHIIPPMDVGHSVYLGRIVKFFVNSVVVQTTKALHSVTRCPSYAVSDRESRG